MESEEIVNSTQGEEGSVCTLVDKTFGGKLATTYRCLTCGNESARIESFTDIPLAFPEYKPVGVPATSNSQQDSEGKDEGKNGKVKRNSGKEEGK